MFLKSSTIAGRTILNILLFLIYLYFFGQHSVQKYLDQGVIIVNHKEIQKVISPPGQSKRSYLDV